MPLPEHSAMLSHKLCHQQEMNEFEEIIVQPKKKMLINFAKP
jgi:hypothetical protein